MTPQLLSTQLSFTSNFLTPQTPLLSGKISLSLSLSRNPNSHPPLLKMSTHSSKSQLEQTHFDDTPSLRVSSTTKNKSKSQRRRKKKYLIHPNKRTYLEGKLGQLMKIFTPIPFKPLDLSSFSASQENLLKRAGLWDFLHLKFDPELRADLIAELIVGYNPQAPPNSRSFVNGRPVMLTRAEMGCALALPSRGRKVAAKEEEAGERFCGLEVISEEEVLFLEKVVLKSVVLCGVDDGLQDDVLKVIRFIKEERRPERVDWRGLIWVMVEKELGKGVELRECYYASHLEWFLRKRRPTLFAKEVGKLGFYDLGVQKLELEISGVDEKESEKKVKGLVGHQRRKRKSGKMIRREGEDPESKRGSGLVLVGYQRRMGKSGKMVCSEGEDPESKKGSDLVLVGYQRRKGQSGKMIASEGEDPESERGSGLGLGLEGGNGMRLEVSIFGENQLGGSIFGHAEGTNEEKLEVGNFGGNLNESVVGGLWEKGGDSVGRKSCVDVDCVEEVINEGLMGLKNVEGGLMKGGEEVGSENIGLITEVGKEDCKVDPLFEGGCLVDLKISGSDDAYTIDIGNEETESLVQNSEQDNVPDVKVSGADLITEHGENNVVGEERSGVNGRKFDDQPLIELENDNYGLSSIQDGDAYVLEGECLMKESEDKGGEGRNDNICLITGEGKEDKSKADFSEKGGNTEMGGYSDICAMELGEKKSKLLLQRGEEDNVADVIMEGSYDNGVKQMENELADCLTEQGKDDQLRMDVLVEDEGLISVETRVEQELKEKQMENEPICLTQDKSDDRDLKIGKGSDVQMVVVSEKEVEDRSLGLCLLQGEMKMEGPLKEGEDTKMRSADDDNGKQMEITQMDISLEHGNSVLENQEKSMHLRQSEKAEVIVQEDFVKEDGAAVDVEVRSFGSSSGNELESTQIELCAGQTTGGNDFVEAVKKDCIVDFEDIEEKHRRQELFQNCSLRMDAGYESQSEKEVEVREEDNVDIKDMEDQDKESRFQHCSPNTDTLSDSISEKAVEISEEDTVSDSASEKAVEISDKDSPHGIVNDCSVVEPFELGTSMMDQDFFGNASNRKNSCENDVFVEPFVLEHDINANIRGSSVFENPLKTEIDLMNDGHKRLRTEGLSEKMPMPLKRKMNNTNDGHGIMRSGGRSNKGLEDFSSWGEQVDFWLGQTKMVVAAREDVWLSAQMEEQMLSKKLEQQDKTFHLLGKTKLEELEKRNSKINCIENELFFMANQIDHYKNALETTRMTFAAFRERCKLPEEPLYVDIPGSGGIVLSSNEWEKERLRREQEERNNRLDTMITTFQLHWFNQFDGPKKMIKSLGDRLSVIENEVEDLKKTFQNMIFGE